MTGSNGDTTSVYEQKFAGPESTGFPEVSRPGRSARSIESRSNGPLSVRVRTISPVLLEWDRAVDPGKRFDSVPNVWKLGGFATGEGCRAVNVNPSST